MPWKKYWSVACPHILAEHSTPSTVRACPSLSFFSLPQFFDPIRLTQGCAAVLNVQVQSYQPPDFQVLTCAVLSRGFCAVLVLSCLRILYLHFQPISHSLFISSNFQLPLRLHKILNTKTPQKLLSCSLHLVPPSFFPLLHLPLSPQPIAAPLTAFNPPIKLPTRIKTNRTIKPTALWGTQKASPAN